MDFIDMKSKAFTSKKPDKKAMKATWDSESESEEENDTKNGFFKAQNNKTTKVTFKPTLDNSDLSTDELGDAFE